MNILEFISKIIESIAWPVSIIILGIVLKNPIKSLIPLLTKLKYKDIELQFGNDLTNLTEKVNQELANVQNKPETDDLRERTMSIIQVSPKSAIIEVWRDLERVIVGISTRNKVDLDRNLLKKPIKLAETLLKEKLIDETQYSIIEDMRILRNKVVHYEKEQITAENALEYLDSGIKLISSLNKNNTSNNRNSPYSQR